MIEDLRIKNMTGAAKGTLAKPGVSVAQKRGLNGSILAQGWGELHRQLAYKTGWYGSQLAVVPASYTSQTCSACGVLDPRSRESQARFRCVACGHAENADVNAARVILARAANGHEDGGRIRPLQRGEPSRRKPGLGTANHPAESGMTPSPAAGNPRASARGGDQGIGYATTGSPIGPFAKSPANSILAQTPAVVGPGGGDELVTGPHGGWWLLFAARGPIANAPRTLRLDPFSWQPAPTAGAPDLPVISGPSSTLQPTQP